MKYRRLTLRNPSSLSSTPKAVILFPGLDLQKNLDVNLVQCLQEKGPKGGPADQLLWCLVFQLSVYTISPNPLPSKIVEFEKFGMNVEMKIFPERREEMPCKMFAETPGYNVFISNLSLEKLCIF